MPTRCWREVRYVGSDRADFNDRFVEQLAFPADADRSGRVVVLACGAIALHIADIARRRQWSLTFSLCRRCCTTTQQRIAPRWRRTAGLVSAYETVVGADCGTYGTPRRGLRAARDRGACRVCALLRPFAGATGSRWLAEQPGTFFTDFSRQVLSTETVWRELRPRPLSAVARGTTSCHFTWVIWLA